MDNKRQDRRVRYTKKVLKETLAVLMREKPVGKLSVKEICSAADVNRSTFYAHYSDPYDLLRQVEEELIDELYGKLDGFNLRDDDLQSQRVICSIFMHIEENRELCRSLLGENGDLRFQREIMTLVQQQCVLDRPDESYGEQIEYLALFITNGCIGLVQKWLQDGIDSGVSAEKIAALVIRLARQGMSAFI